MMGAMTRPARFLKTLLSDNDALAAHREKVIAPVSGAAAVLLGLFAVNNFLHDRWLVGAAVSLVVALLVADLRAVRRGARPPVPYVLVIAPAIAGILVSVSLQGAYGALWGYPLVFICYFALSRRAALALSVLTMLAITGAVAWWIEPALAVRFFATLLLTIVMINIVLNVLAELQDSLVRQTLTDPLTGAFNRRHMEQSLSMVVEQGRRRMPANVLLALDIDHFKEINDRLGHDAGDEVLRQLVRVVRGRLRKIDLLFRVGGEEFIVLLRDTDAAGAAALAEDLRQRIAAEPARPDLAVTVSIGVCPQLTTQDVDDWIKQADLALYRAKRAGRNRVEVVELPGRPAARAA